MFKIVGLQILMTSVVALCSGFIAGPAAAVSALLGGAACFVPNALLAARLAFLVRRKPQGVGVQTFFVGEFIKLGLTLALLVAFSRSYSDLVWLAMIIAIAACLKSYLLVFWLDRIQYR